MEAKFVAYYRVSTQQQGRSGLGLEAQQQSIKDYLNQKPHRLVGTFTEVESGRCCERPALREALSTCRSKGATLVVAKLDRLARNVQFLLKVVSESGERGVVFCDLPTIPDGPVGKFIVTQMASIAELEAGLISKRTKEALRAAKARGVKLGGNRGNLPSVCREGSKAAAIVRARKARERDADVLPRIHELIAEGVSLRDIADALNAEGRTAPRGGKFHLTSIVRILERAKGK